MIAAYSYSFEQATIFNRLINRYLHNTQIIETDYQIVSEVSS